MESVVIFGGTGFLGLSLAKYLSKNGLHPILVARNRPGSSLGNEFRQWDVISLCEWVQALEGAKAIVNLAGQSVDCIKTPENCDLILRSRVESTRTIGRALMAVKKLPQVWVQMSTAHIYGDPPTQLCTERSATGFGLAPFVGEAWENAFLLSLPKGVRGITLRTSFVIGKKGGALPKLKRLVKIGLGGKVGSGKQGMSWIHQFDLNQIIHQAITDQKYNGMYVASSPKPVSNQEFMQMLRKKMNVSIGIPTPAMITRIGAKLIFKTDPDLALYGRYVIPSRLVEEGFEFRFPNLEDALEDLLGKN